MKRFLALLTAIAFLIVLAGCALPTGKENITPENTQGTSETEKTTVGNESGSMNNSAGVKESTVNEAVARENIVLTPITLYYQDADGYLIPMTRWVEKQTGIARAAVYGLTDSSVIREELQYYGVYPVLPAGTEVLGLNIKDGIATVDLGSKLLDYDNEDIERRMIAALVYTLTEFPTIAGVKLRVEGKALDTMKYGTDVSGLLSRSNVPINSKLQIGDKKADAFYFKRSNEGFTYVLPVSLKIEGTEEITPAVQLRQLLSEKTDGKLISVIPEGVELLSCTGSNGTMVMDFSDRLLEVEGANNVEEMLKQLVYTARQSGGISKVRITVNGEAASLEGGKNISSGISVPRTINDIIDR